MSGTRGPPSRRSAGRAARGTYRKQPTQARARATVDVILQAARRVLVRTGYAKFTTNAVARTAGVSVGSLYQYFPDKRALVGAVLEDHVERKTSELRRDRRKLAQASLEQLIHGYAQWMVESHRDEPALHRILAEELPRQGLSSKLAADYERGIASVCQMLAARASELVPQNHELSAFIIVHTMEALTKAALQRDPRMLDDDLIDEITALIMGYLKPGASRRSTT